MVNLYPEFFKRVDERPDELFYQEPRFVTHIDEGAQRAAYRWYSDLLPRGGHVLDLMSSYRSHLPGDLGQVVGLGLNQAELDANPSLSQGIVYDLNRQADLPFASSHFDGVVCTVSVQYMTRPDDTFKAVARVLKPGAPFAVTFSNRMFPTKAVLAWRASDDAAHIRLVKSYFENASLFGETETRFHTPENGDPLYSVIARKRNDLN